MKNTQDTKTSTRLAKLPLVLALSASLLLTACQPGNQGDETDGNGSSSDQTTQIQSNTDGGQGGAVVTEGSGKSAAEEDSSSEFPNASKKTGFDDLWILDSVGDKSNPTSLYDDEDILYYGTTYEVVCAMEFYMDDDRLFACALPGMDLVGEWEEISETEANISIPMSDTESLTAKCKMSNDYQHAALTLLPFDGSGSSFVYYFHRDDDTTLSLDDMYAAMIKNNDEFYNSLIIENPQDITFVDDDNITMKLLGTTSTESMKGYVLEVTNKTGVYLLLNDFMLNDNDASIFTINGSTMVRGLTGRVLPPSITDKETGETTVASMRCAILFDKDEIGDITSCTGNLLVTDYHWKEVGRYPFVI